MSFLSLATSGLGLGLGLATSGLGLGLATSGLVNKPVVPLLPSLLSGL